MRKTITILICKIVRFLAKLLGRGSSLPGKIALMIYPKILKEIKLPKYIIAVTGSNGKTSTVEMIKQVLDNAGYSVAYNYEGSNQIDGVATLILANSSLSGVFTKDILLLESDERYAKYTFNYFAPTHYLITNLYRDQMTRNGHPEYVLAQIEKSIKEESKLILNGDDPLISSLSKKCLNDIVYFGINENQYSSKENNSKYNDGLYCPICKSKMNYDYYHFNHVGKYACTNCDFKEEDLKYYISSIDLSKEEMVINDQDHIYLAFSAMYNAYNVLAAYALCKELDIDSSIICSTLNNYLITNGRIKTFTINNHQGTLLISKHENSISYNQNLKYICSLEKDVTVFILIDSISRKYFSSETSWLWDIDFELLNSSNVKRIILAGTYDNDLAVRFSYADISFEKIHIEKDIHLAYEYLKEEGIGDFYIITCFSDENKFMKEVKND